MTTRQMHFVGYLIAGPTWHNNGGWRHPESDADLALDARRYERIAEILEEGKFDALFFVDVLTLFDTYQGGFNGQVAGPGQMWFLDPLLLLAAMARKDTPYRSGGYPVDRLLPPIPHRPRLCHARSYERRTCRVERGHYGQFARGTELRPGQTNGP